PHPAGISPQAPNHRSHSLHLGLVPSEIGSAELLTPPADCLRDRVHAPNERVRAFAQFGRVEAPAAAEIASRGLGMVSHRGGEDAETQLDLREPVLRALSDPGEPPPGRLFGDIRARLLADDFRRTEVRVNVDYVRNLARE